MAASDLQFTFTNVSITPQGGSAISMTRTTNLRITRTDELDTWQGSGDDFDSVVVVTRRRREFSIDGGDIAKALTIPSNTVCSVTGKLLDARNGAGQGAITVTIANAILQDSSFGSASRKFGQVGVDFIAYAPDGSTDPFSFTVASGS